MIVEKEGVSVDCCQAKKSGWQIPSRHKINLGLNSTAVNYPKNTDSKSLIIIWFSKPFFRNFSY